MFIYLRMSDGHEYALHASEQTPEGDIVSKAEWDGKNNIRWIIGEPRYIPFAGWPEPCSE
jgi:hypothetical protein